MTLFQMSVTAGIMILAVAALRLLLGRRLPKKTFLLLWAVVLCRLLIPFEIPSPLSVYTTVPQAVEVARVTAAAVQTGLPPAHLPTAANQLEPVAVVGNTSPLLWLWRGGSGLCALFFLCSYLRSRWLFREAFPAEEAAPWLAAHPLRRPLAVRKTDRVDTPLTYGVLRPVILLPAAADWSDGERLGYVLSHELVHVKRLDAVWKLLLTAALCLHWWNPAVWLMAYCANLDLELSCDEAVVRALGEDARRAYAKTLIGMEARRSGLLPLYNGFSRNSIEERVKAVMKFKPFTAWAAAAAVVVVVAVAAGFATSAQRDENPDPDPHTTTIPVGTATVETPPGSTEDYETVLSLMVRDYENLSLAGFHEMFRRQMEEPGFSDAYDRVYGDLMQQAEHYPLTAQQLDFLIWTLNATKREVAAAEGEMALFEITYSRSKDGEDIFLSYPVRYRVIDPQNLTVGMRDLTLREVTLVSRSWLEQQSAYELAHLSTYELAESLSRRLGDISHLGDRPHLEFAPLEPEELVYNFMMNPVFTSNEGVEFDRLEVDTNNEGRSILFTMWNNYDTRTVKRLTCSMLAYDQNGQPLKDRWDNYEGGSMADYERIVDLDATIAPGHDTDVMGRFPLTEPTQVAYAVGCVVRAEFEDGTTWENPSYESWREAHVGQPLPIGEFPIPDGVAAAANDYLLLLTAGDMEAAYYACYYRPDGPNIEELRGGFLDSPPPVGATVEGIAPLGPRLWQVDVRYENAIAALGTRYASNYVAEIDGAYRFIISSRDIPDDLLPADMARAPVIQ